MNKSDVYPEWKKRLWPVCVCKECIKCGCNQPWNHHVLLNECEILEKVNAGTS